MSRRVRIRRRCDPRRTEAYLVAQMATAAAAAATAAATAAAATVAVAVEAIR